MQKLSTLPFMLLVSLFLAGCAGNPLVKTSKDNQEIRFDTVKGGIELSYASITGIANAVKASKDSGAMSDQTASKIKEQLQNSLDATHEAKRLLDVGDIEGATIEIKSARLILEVVKSSLARSGINLEDAQL